MDDRYGLGATPRTLALVYAAAGTRSETCGAARRMFDPDRFPFIEGGRHDALAEVPRSQTALFGVSYKD